MNGFERAAALLADRKPAEAAEAFDRLLQDDPANAEVIFHASVAHAATGNYRSALAVALRGTELHPGWWRGHAQAGALLLALDRPGEAIPYLVRARDLLPGNVDVLNNLGAAYRAAGRSSEALTIFRSALDIDPGNVNVVRNLASALTADDRNEEAAVALQALVDAGHASADLYNVLGKAIWKSGDLEGGLAWFERALQLDPGFASAITHRGAALLERGDLEQGKADLRAALDLEPRPEFFFHLAEADVNALTDDDLRILETLSGIDADYALARVYAAKGDHQRSFRHLIAANTAMRATLPYDESDVLGVMSRMPSFFSRSVLERAAQDANPSHRPIFIVGMPRSGTTLIEQILASHSKVYGAGELTLFAEISEKILTERGVPPERLPTDASLLREIGDRYLAALDDLAPADALRVTDKMPDNFRAVGLIALALPNATIVHSRRNPLETCLSCFSIKFASRSMAWTYDLRELGRYYRAYERLMTHWSQALPPGKMLEVQYEDVVGDLEGQARRIIAFCGLEWEDRCLAFYETKRPVKTASVTQVRRPIYRSSLSRAEKYGDLLAPLVDVLEDTPAT